MFQEPTPDGMDDAGGSRRPGIGVVLVLLMLLGFFANAALFQVASDAARWIPDRAVSPLRGGSGPDGLSTDITSTARIVFRPHRGALSSMGSFRAPGWKPHIIRVLRGSASERCKPDGNSA